MDQSNGTNPENSAKEKEIFFIQTMAKRSVLPEDIVPKLIEHFGMEYQAAYDLTQQHYPEKLLKIAKHSEGGGSNRTLIWGLVILGIGLAVTFSPGSNVIAYGAIIVGAIRVVQGIAGR